jgi:predicted methyltransferase
MDKIKGVKMENFLDVEIEDRPEVTITDIGTKEIEMKDKVQAKCIFTCETSDGRSLNISDVYVHDKDKNQKIQGLWWNGKITPGSALYKLLNYHNVAKLRDLIGKKVIVCPDPNDFLILTTIDVKKPSTAPPTKAALI